MSKRILFSLSAAAVLGAAAVVRHCSCFFLLGTALVLYLFYEKKTLFTLLPWLCLLCMGAGSWHSFYKMQLRESYTDTFAEGSACCVQGKIYKKEEKSLSYYYLKNCRVSYQNEPYSCEQLLVYLDTDEIPIGKTILVQGNIKQFSLPRNEGNYNERQYYHSRNIEFALKDAEILASFGREDFFKEFLYAQKKRLQKSFSACMQTKDAGVMIAMTLGDTSFMEETRKLGYQKSGISHFYSVSGLHIGLIGMAFYNLLRRIPLSYGVSGLFAGLWIVAYGSLTGFGISAARAIGMFLLQIYGKARGRCTDGWTSLGILAFFMVWENPYVLYHTGFLLSYGAVAGVYLAQETKGLPRVSSAFVTSAEDFPRKRISSFKASADKVFNPIKESLSVSFWIQAVTLPILANGFYEISIYSMFVNLCILPFMGILFGFGLCGGILGCFHRRVGIAVLFVCHGILGFFDSICMLFLKLPNAVFICGHFPQWKLLLWYAVLGILFLGQKRRCKQSERMPEEENSAKECSLWVCLLRVCRHYGLYLAVCAGFAGLLGYLPKEKNTIAFLDVGQGDGSCIQNTDGTAFFVDGGSSDVSKVGTYRILPYLKYHGIQKIEYWFVSHCDADHISGLQEILAAGYPIGSLVLSAECPKEETYKALTALARKNGTEVLEMKQGERLSAWDTSGECLWQMECVYPLHTENTAAAMQTMESDTQDKNELSMAIFYKNQVFSAFFGGDLGAEQEKSLLEADILQKTDVFKALHHGSKYSNSKEFLQVLAPQVTVISCGEKNRYGHPSKEAIEHIENTNSALYYTMKGGRIKVYQKDGEMCAESYCLQGGTPSYEQQ